MAGVACAEPGSEPLGGLRRGIGPRNPAKIEAKLARFSFERRLEIARQKSRSA
jgi:hypothetical protein